MPYKFKDITKRLNKLGYQIVRQKGSHVIFSNGRVTIPVPKHGGRDISSGVERKIISVISMTKEEFKDVI